MTDHSYEDIREVAIGLLAGREHPEKTFSSYDRFARWVAEVFREREEGSVDLVRREPARLSTPDMMLFREVFWDLFRQGLITLGTAEDHKDLAHFSMSRFGKKALESERLYYFYDVSSYKKAVRKEIPKIDDVTLVYLEEAMRAFAANCCLSATVMLGVATEDSFELLLEDTQQNAGYAALFRSLLKDRSILRKVNKFRKVLEHKVESLPPHVKEGLDTNFSGIIELIRTFRNKSGHPTGKIIDREQTYVLLNLFIPYCKKIYQLREFFSVSHQK